MTNMNPFDPSSPYYDLYNVLYNPNNTPSTPGSPSSPSNASSLSSADPLEVTPPSILSFANTVGGAVLALQKQLNARDLQILLSSRDFYIGVTLDSNLLAQAIARAESEYKADKAIYDKEKPAVDNVNTAIQGSNPPPVGGIDGSIATFNASFNTASINSAYNTYVAQATSLNTKIANHTVTSNDITNYNAAALAYNNLVVSYNSHATTLNNALGVFNVSQNAYPAGSYNNAVVTYNNAIVSINNDIAARNTKFPELNPLSPLPSLNTIPSVGNNLPTPTINLNTDPTKVTAVTIVNETFIPTPVSNPPVPFPEPVQPNEDTYLAQAIADFQNTLAIYQRTTKDYQIQNTGVIDASVLKIVKSSVAPNAYITTDNTSGNTTGGGQTVLPGISNTDLTSPVNASIGSKAALDAATLPKELAPDSVLNTTSSNLLLVTAILSAKVGQMSMLDAGLTLGTHSMASLPPNEVTSSLLESLAFTKLVNDFVKNNLGQIGLTEAQQAIVTNALLNAGVNNLGSAINVPNLEGQLSNAAQVVSNSSNLQDVFDRLVVPNGQLLVSSGPLGSAYNQAIASILTSQGVESGQAQQAASQVTSSSFSSQQDLNNLLTQLVGQNIANNTLAQITQQYQVAILNTVTSNLGFLTTAGVDALEAQRIADQHFNTIDELQTNLKKAIGDQQALVVLNKLREPLASVFLRSAFVPSVQQTLTAQALGPEAQQNILNDFSRTMFGYVPGQTPEFTSYFQTMVDAKNKVAKEERTFSTEQSQAFKASIAEYTTSINQFITQHILSPQNFMSLWGIMYEGAKGSGFKQKTVDIQV